MTSLDPSDPLVTIYPSAYAAACALRTKQAVDSEGCEATVARLIAAGRIVHAWNVDLPAHKRVGGYDRKNGFYSRHASAWLVRDRRTAPSGWWLFDSQNGHEPTPGSPAPTKRKALERIGEDSASRLDTGLYEAGGYVLASTEAAVEHGYLDIE